MAKRPPQIEISKYKGDRHWAVWVGGELLAVVLYKKGAVAIRDAILKIWRSR